MQGQNSLGAFKQRNYEMMDEKRMLSLQKYFGPSRRKGTFRSFEAERYLLALWVGNDTFLVLQDITTTLLQYSSQKYTFWSFESGIYFGPSSRKFFLRRLLQLRLLVLNKAISWENTLQFWTVKIERGKDEVTLSFRMVLSHAKAQFDRKLLRRKQKKFIACW